MSKPMTGFSLTLLLAGMLMLGSAQAQSPGTSQSAATADQTVQTKTKVKKKKKTTTVVRGGRAKFMAGSQETPAQRSARLTRECKDGVNAGACTGYTR